MAVTRIAPMGWVEIRTATPIDHDWILGLAEGLFVDLGNYREILGDWLVAPRAEAIIATGGDERLGFAVVAPRPRIGFLRRCGSELVAIAVVERVRRGGIARRLIGEAQQRAIAFGAREMRLHTAESNEVGQALFRDCGFRSKRGLPVFYPSGVRALEFGAALEPAAESSSSR